MNCGPRGRFYSLPDQGHRVTGNVARIFHRLADLQAAHAISQVGADTVITLNSDPAHLNQITLRGVAANALSADHFWFL